MAGQPDNRTLHTLSRVVRFSVNPFLEQTEIGANSCCSKPSGEGLAIFFSLWVELVGSIDPDTGFVVNLTDIDRSVRQFAVPVFDGLVREKYNKCMHISFNDLKKALIDTQKSLKEKFSPAFIHSVGLELNPFRKLKIDTENLDMIRYSEKFEFAAMHKLWNPKFSEEKNFEVFGKCANPAGHGHNYIVEVTVEVENSRDFLYGKFQSIVDDNFINLVDHKNLNEDVQYFEDKNPTVENITAFGWGCLSDKFADAKLYSVTVWENDRAFCTYTG